MLFVCFLVIKPLFQSKFSRLEPSTSSFVIEFGENDNLNKATFPNKYGTLPSIGANQNITDISNSVSPELRKVMGNNERGSDSTGTSPSLEEVPQRPGASLMTRSQQQQGNSLLLGQPNNGNNPLGSTYSRHITRFASYFILLKLADQTF